MDGELWNNKDSQRLCEVSALDPARFVPGGSVTVDINEHMATFVQLDAEFILHAGTGKLHIKVIDDKPQPVAGGKIRVTMLVIQRLA